VKQMITIAYHQPTDAQPVPKQCPPPTFLLLSMTPYGTEFPSGQLGSGVPAVSPPNFSCTPSLLAGRAVWGAEKAL